MPFEVRTRLGCILDGDYGNVTSGRIDFAIKMEIKEELARCAKCSNDIMDALLTLRVCVHDMIIALRDIDRTDAMNVLVEWVQTRGIAQQ